MMGWQQQDVTGEERRWVGVKERHSDAARELRWKVLMAR
jgi:hypothetical protein